MSNLLKRLAVLANAPIPDMTGPFAELEDLKARLARESDIDGSLTRTFFKAAERIAGQAALLYLTPQTDRALLEQLWRDEKVHPLASFDEYMATRIGIPGCHKGALALVAKGKDGPRGLTAIYNYYDRILSGPDGVTDPEDLRGDIHTIKSETPRRFPKGYEPNIVYFYTVTSKLPRAAYTLIRKVAELHQEFLKCTVSPAREFTKTQDMDAFDTLPVQERKAQVAAHIASREGYRNMNSVAFFHMDNGNGAYAASIKFNPGMPDDRVMMNYVYPSDGKVAYDNQRAFRAGYVPVGPAVHSALPEEKKDRVFVSGNILRVQPPSYDDLFIDI